MMLAEFGITKKDVFRYTLLPEIIPRTRKLVGSGFHNLAFLMALVFNTARILPNNHPYLRSANFGTYGMRHVIAAAAGYLVPRWKNVDQFAVFFAILAAIVILVLQIILIVIAAIIGTADAAATANESMPTNYAGFFKTPEPATDIAFKLLDLVFGVPRFFGSNALQNGPTTAQLALQSLFQFYSLGLLLVGFFIILYFVIAIVAETAQSGSPFGTRFNGVWAPIRLVVFFALIIPIASGLNGSQVITLYAAKYGSGLATNGWLKFNEVISGKYLGEKEELVGKPKPPEMAYLLAYMLVTRTCLYTEGDGGRKIDGYIITGAGAAGAMPLSSSYADVTAKTKGADVHIRFGEQDATKHEKWSGNVYPYCGELVIHTSDTAEPGAAKIQESYLRLVEQMWTGSYQIDQHAKNFNLKYTTVAGSNPAAPLPPPSYKSDTSKQIMEKVEKDVEDAVKVQAEEGKWDPDEDMKKRGWAGAGMWYNKIAQQNGALTTAVGNPPQIREMPSVMTEVKTKKVAQNHNFEADDQYSPFLSSGEPVKLDDQDHDLNKAAVLNETYVYLMREGFSTDEIAAQNKLTGNIIIDTINLLFGTKGLYDMCKDTKIHPLAQLSSMGKTLIESSVRAMGFSVFSGVIGGAAKLFSEHLASAGFAAASFFMTVATIGLLLGFLLFYVIPFMPFIYFFFGVGSWLKGIFEAMVGVPLWALAHLRIDGEGLPGQAASSGYFLIFEIFIRPILMVFGLLAAIVVFSALVKVLNDIFYLVIANVSGHDPTSSQACFQNPNGGAEGGAAGGGTGGGAGGGGDTTDASKLFRGPIDEFFFTIIYAVIVYMIGMSCFKLIDQIPDNILRWMNEGGAFGDKDQDPAENLMQKITVGGGVVGSQLKGSLDGFANIFR